MSGGGETADHKDIPRNLYLPGTLKGWCQFKVLQADWPNKTRCRGSNNMEQA